jgi:phosphoadenosine phosphosulfate reductase
MSIKDEAFSFVRHAVERFDEEKIVISFSGGKDSTATADVVVKALSNPSLAMMSLVTSSVISNGLQG